MTPEDYDKEIARAAGAVGDNERSRLAVGIVRRVRVFVRDCIEIVREDIAAFRH